jgi:hypothetical protein
MKKGTLLSAAILAIHFLSAQYCGNSGPGICTPQTQTQPGLFPLSPEQPPFINGQVANTVIEFENFDTVYFDGSSFVLQTLTIDTISNLPNGLCWATNQASNTYNNQQVGCILLSGTTCAQPGQYKLNIVVTVNVGFTVTVNADVADLFYFLRVDNAGETATPVDTTQTSSNPFIAYGPSAICPVTPLSVSLGPDLLVCNGSIITLKPLVSAGQPPYSFLWQSTGDTLSCDTCEQPNVTLNENSTFIVTVTDANDSIVSDTVAYTVSGAGIDFHIASAGLTTFCQGDSVILSSNGSGLTYQWAVNGDAISGATDTVYTVKNTSGSYQLYYTEPGGCNATSNVVQVTVNPLPVVSLTLSPDTLCDHSAPVGLTGFPPGGVFSGPGVSNGQFTPDSALAGSQTLAYAYTNGNGCSNSANATAVVEICTGLNDPVIERSISMFPNPVGEVLIVESNFFSANNVVAVVTDATGRSVPVAYTRQGSQLVFNTSGLAPGVYWVRMLVNGSQVTRKFVKMQ